MREAQQRRRDKIKREKEERRKAAAQRILRFIQDRKIRKYTVDILVTWIIKKGQYPPYEAIENFQSTFRTTESKLRNYVNEFVESLRVKRLGVSGSLDIETLDIKYTYVKIEDNTADDLAKVCMRDIGKCDLDGYEKMFKWHKNKGTCVFDYLIYTIW